jgi:hypothetical protein
MGGSAEVRFNRDSSTPASQACQHFSTLRPSGFACQHVSLRKP